MRSATVTTITGVIKNDGVPLQGPLTCCRTSAGVYELYPPPGMKIVGLVAMPMAVPGDSWGWHFVITDQDVTAGAPFRVAIANSTAGANVDRAFRYVATVVA